MAGSTVSKELRESTYERMRNDIVYGVIPLGQRIIEADFTSHYNVSRTPVRYAIQRLEREGFLESIPGNGILVTFPLLQDLDEYSNIYISMLGLLLRYAVRKVKDADIIQLYTLVEQVEDLIKQDEPHDEQLSLLCQEFHNRIVLIADIPPIQSMLEILPDYEHFECLKPYLDRNMRTASYLEHRAIVDALRDRNEELLRIRYAKHYQNSTANRKQAYQKMRGLLNNLIAKKTCKKRNL